MAMSALRASLAAAATSFPESKSIWDDGNNAQSLQGRSGKPNVVLPMCGAPAWGHDRISSRRIHLRRASSGDHGDIRMPSNHGNPAHILAVQRQDSIPVFQQDDALFLHSLSHIEAV